MSKLPISGESDRNLPSRRPADDAHAPAAGRAGMVPGPAAGPPNGNGGAPPLYYEEEIDLRDVWSILRRRKWVVLGTLGLVLAAAAAFTWLRTPVWRASTLVRVEDGEQTDVPVLDVLATLQQGSQIETEMKILESRPIVAVVVDSLDLHFRVAEPADAPRASLFERVDLGRDVPEAAYAIEPLGSGRFRLTSTDAELMAEQAVAPVRVEFRAGETVEIPGGSFVLADAGAATAAAGAVAADEAGASDAVADDAAASGAATESIEAERADLLAGGIAIETVPFLEGVRDVSEHLQVNRPDREANVVEIAYEGTDRELVMRVPNTLAASFIARRQGVQKTEVRSTVSFLERQTEQLRSQLEAAEEELQEFREGEQIVALGAAAESQVQRLADLEAQRTQLAAERDALANLLHEVERGASPDYRKLAAFPTFLQNEAVANLLEALTAAEGARSQLLGRLMPDHPDVITITDRIEQLEGRLGDIGRNYLSALNDQIASLEAVLTRFGSELEEIPAREVQFARLERQVHVLSDLYTLLQTRLKEAEIAEAVENPSVRVVEAAILPFEPESPRPIRDLALAGVLGLMLGIGLAFVREYLDNRIHGSEDVEEALGLPTIGRIPVLPRANGKRNGARRLGVARAAAARAGGRLVGANGAAGANGAGANGNGADGTGSLRHERESALVTVHRASPAGAEAFRTLRTNVRFVRGGAGAREMVVTSPGPREGKSTTAANLAAAFAQQGIRTLLIDADMRRPVQHFQFGAEPEPGLSDVLTGDVDWLEATQETTVEDLFLLPAGASPPNPAELLGNARMEALLDAARGEFASVVIDTPPVLAVTDAAVLGRRVEGVVLVVRAEMTQREAADSAAAQLQRVGAAILGVVLNETKSDGAYGYGYGYDYGVYHGDPRPRWKRLVGLG